MLIESLIAYAIIIWQLLAASAICTGIYKQIGQVQKQHRKYLANITTLEKQRSHIFTVLNAE